MISFFMFLKRILIFTMITGLLSCTGSNSKLANRVVIKVDQLELKATEFSEKLAIKLKSFDALTAKDVSVFNRAKNEVLDEFILDALAVKWSQENGVQLKDSFVKEEFEKLRRAYPDELSFKRALSTEGLSFQVWQKKFRSTLLQKVVLNEITSKVEKPTAEEIKSYYQKNPAEFRTKDQMKLRQIVLKTENNANRIFKELKNGRKFGDLAKKFSITPEASEEGLVGWVEKGTSDVFDEAYKDGVKLNSKILKSNFGFHIIEILNIKKGGLVDLKSVEDIIVNKLIDQKKQKVFSDWLEAELRKSRVFKDEGLIQSIYAETKG
ncbi:MAG: peptidyl-prolyl cis-trans isomerase [Bdellovibrionaceae bacterium]|nr:peptidyl-prolyl cis-trans isomerase [Pseudobdellovibrionaceae bacterium]